jgi:DNA mismatch repair protein MutL
MESSAPRIEVLSPSVIEKIAAGEVIERPASVVKELVENALDARADRIDVVIENGGFSRLQVADNGFGMGPADLEQAVIRHATSKIRSADDLFAIATLGFRGEALASIAAVSRFTISSSESSDGLGYELHVEGGITGAVSPRQHNRGTTVVCRDLFFNVPARKKFMKSEKAERLAIVRLIEQLAAPYPQVHFSVTADGKKAFDAPPAAGLLERIAQIAGTEFARNLITCTSERESLGATVFITDPAHASPRPRFQCLFVNLRRVDSDSVTYSIREAFSRFITSHFKPAWFCFLDIDTDRIDVNVHPTKQKIKFDNERMIFGVTFDTVHSGVGEKMRAGIVPAQLEAPSDVQPGLTPFPSRRPDGVAGAQTLAERSGGAGYAPASAGAVDGREEQTTLQFLSLASRAGAQKEVVENPDQRVQLAQEQWDLIPCYQIHKSYILAPMKNGILMLDQHAAHERILFEQATGDMVRGRADSQRLLFPIVIEFTVTEKAAVISNRDHFTSVGFDIQDFGGQSIAVAAIPAAGFMSQSNVEEALRQMVEALLEERDAKLLSEPQRRFAAAFACGAAIKQGQALKQEEMNSLLNALFAAENPYTCPHGRPTLIRMSLEEIGRRFLR